VFIGAVLGCLLLALALVVQKIFYERELSRVRNLGCVMAMSFFCEIDADYGQYSPADSWKSYSCASNTTSFFTNEISIFQSLRADYSFFSAPGISPYKGTNAALFKPENNAWCMTGDLTSKSSDLVPLFLTRNVKVSTLAELQGRVADTLSDEAPFGKKSVIVVLKGFKAMVIDGSEDWSSVFGTHVYTNRILRP